MAFQPTVDVASLELRYVWQDQLVENVLHWRKPGFTLADMETLAQAGYNAWVNNFANITSSTVVLREAYVTDLRTQDGPTASFVPGTLVGGNNVNESVTNNTTLCISLRTALRGRSRRGRFYVVGMTENTVANNRVSVAARDAWVDAFAAFVGDVQSTDWSLVVLSRRLNNAPRPVASSADVTSWLTVDDVVDSQRRRLPGRGQ